ncbi:MAG TPA: cellulase family glycosylhydrolase [Acetobacteraceae bacterium]|nr:cellulase family glycosylhydrolase [Acetobacteraceae bacterium]
MTNFTVSATSGFAAPNGQPWTMRGLNAGVQDALQGFANVLTDYPGLTAIRLNVVPGSDSAASIDQVVQEYTAKGIVVEIEDHSGNGDNVAWYQQMATAYKGNPLVFLETPNEPSTAAATTAQYQIGIINAIRAAGFTGLIGVQPNGGWDFANVSTVTAAVGTAGLFVTPHIYYNGTDPNGAAQYVQGDVQTAKGLGLFASIDEFGNAIDGYTLDPQGNTVITAVVAANEAGQAGAVFWAMDNDNHPDGTDSAFLNPNGTQLTPVGKNLQPWLSQPTSPTGGGTTPPVTPPTPTGPDGTEITTAAASPIIDQAGNALTLVQSSVNGLQIAVNGIVDQATRNVVLLEFSGGKIVQENANGNWYSEPAPGAGWTHIAAPAAPTSPPPPPSPSTPSQDGTEITTAAASPIIDQAGNALTLVQSASNGLQIAVNGTVDQATRNVALLELNGGKIVQENANGNWYSEPAPGAGWTHIAAPAVPPSVPASSVGGETFVLTKGSAATVALGTGSSQLRFIDAGSLTLVGGSGHAVVTADAGSNEFIAGTGSLDVTGGSGKDAYAFHANSGLLTLEDFSIAKGDSLTIDKALQGSLQETYDGRGGTMLTFGAGAAHGVDLHGMAAMPTTNILWA